jgi:cell division protein FtsQ
MTRYNWWKIGFFALVAVGTVAVVGWVVFGSRLLVVRSVAVVGTHLVPKSEVLAAAAIPTGLPLARVNTGDAARRVERITDVQSAVVTRDWPDRIVITITERRPVLAVPSGRRFDLIDPTGVIVQQVAKQPTGMPRFTPYGPLPHNPGVAAVASVLRSLPPAVARQVRLVTVPAVDAVTLRLANGATVDWGSAGQSGQKARVLAILMHTHAHYYDVSASGTAATG